MKIDSKFPSLKLQTTKGTISLPDDYSGKWILFFSHPGDFTPVCTTEFVAFQSQLHEFEKRNTQLIGLSVEQVYSHLKWIEWIKQNLSVDITFPIIADPIGHIANLLDLLGEEGTSTVRNVIIISPAGVVKAILIYPKEVGRNIYEIIRLLDALQLVEKRNIATPANWPQNNLIGQQVILPAAKTSDEIKKRESEVANGSFNYYDWWFCTQDLSPSQSSSK